MPDLWQLREAVARQIEEDEGCFGIKTAIERELIAGPDDTPAAIVYLEERSAPAAEQDLAMGSVGWLVTINVMVGAFSLGGHARAVQRRDDALRRIEAALLRDRRLGGAAEGLYPQGGRMLSTTQGGGFLAWAESRFVVRLSEEV